MPADELAAALDALDPAVRAGLEVAIENVDAVARAGVGEDRTVTLPPGAPRDAARAAGGARRGLRARRPQPVPVDASSWAWSRPGRPACEEIVVAAPSHPVILAACALCGADEVHRMGGAQAVAALALGTESIAPVDVIVGPGNLYVQEAKRQLSGRVGIDGFAGPSDLLVLASTGADPHAVALDLLAQGEHGADSLVAVVSDDGALLNAIGREVQALDRDRPTVAAGPKVLVDARGLEAALAFAEALAPEHLELIGDAAEALAPRITRAGCVFVGVESATAFGDYVAGSNHTLPTAGAARFASGLNAGHFRRRMSEVRVGDAAAALAAAGVPIAEAEGFAGARRIDVRPDPPESDVMSRSAELTRRTGETDVTVALSLDDTARQQISTGVGFFDHMLELLARHGRLGLGVQVSGDLETGVHHTVEDTGIVLGQALDEALGDRAGIRRYGHAVVPMDEARAACAIDISGRPFCAVTGLDLPAGRDRGLRARGGGGVLPRRRQRGAADAAPRAAGRHERPPHDRGVLQGVRPRAARGRVASTRTRPACPRRRGR